MGLVCNHIKRANGGVWIMRGYAFDKETFEKTWEEWPTMPQEQRYESLLKFNMPPDQARVFSDMSLKDIFAVLFKMRRIGDGLN